MSKISFFSLLEIEEFKNNGFVIVRNLFSKEEMDIIAKHATALLEETPKIGRQMVYLEESVKEPGKKQVCRIENFLPYYAKLKELCDDERILYRLEELFGEPGVLFKEKINYKLPGEGKAAPHQDIQSNWLDYADFFISVQICIDENTIENGCLEVCGGHNKLGLIGEFWEPLSEKITKDMEFVHFAAKPGDCMFFDCFTPHRSNPNMSDVSRSNFYLTYNPASQGDHRELYLSEKRISFPPDNERASGQSYKYRV